MFAEFIDLYAKHWSKREQVEPKYLSEWKDQLKESVVERISNLKRNFKPLECKVLNQPDDSLYKLHTSYVLVTGDKAANNVIVVSKKYSIGYLVEELGINNPNSNNLAYVPTGASYEAILKSHDQFMTSVGLEMSD